MKKLTIILLSFISINLFGQTKTVDLAPFSNLNVAEGIEVTLLSGEARADIDMIKGDIDDLILKIKGNTLSIKFENKDNWFNWNNSRKVKIDLYYETDLEEVNVSSGASVYGESSMSPDFFEGNASSGGHMELVISTSDVEVDVSSGGSIYLSGSAKSLNVDVSSGGSFKGKDLEASIVDVDASSGGGATVWAVTSIDASVSSGGSIKYKGDPEQKDIDASKWSGGNIKKI